MIEQLLSWLAASPWAEALRASRNTYPIVNALHIMAIGSLFGAIVAFDLRLLGFAPAIELRALARYLPRIAGVGLAIAVLTGFALFSVKPLEYADNSAFLLKIALVAFGTVHALCLHRRAQWQRLIRGVGAEVPPGAGLKVSAAVSICTWIAAILAGRFIAF